MILDLTRNKSKGELILKIATLKKLLKYFFALITIHVLVVYFIKNIGGFEINSFAYVIVKMWKEVVLLVFLFLYAYANKEKRIKVNLLDTYIILFILLGIGYTIIAPSKLTALWSFRSIYEIFGFYLLGRFFFLEREELDFFFKTMILMGCLTSIFAIIQVQFLGANFFKEVYGLDEVATAMTTYGYDSIRAPSTFITPHEFGLFLVLCFMFSSYLYKTKKIKKRTFILVNILLLIGLAFSLSRSSILILLICYGLYWVDNIKSTFSFIAICLFAAIVMYFIGVMENFSSVLEGRDPSSMGRLVVLQEFITHVKENPLGSGLGTVGVVVRRFIPSAPQFEGEILNIFAMMSLMGGISYIILLIIPFLNNWRNSRLTSHSINAKNYYRMIAIIVIALTLRELILPRDFTNYVLGWFLIGSSISQSNFSASHNLRGSSAYKVKNCPSNIS